MSSNLLRDVPAIINRATATAMLTNISETIIASIKAILNKSPIIGNTGENIHNITPIAIRKLRFEYARI